MGRGEYLVQAGVGFDVDRSSARKSIGAFEALASMLNKTAANKAAEGFSATEKEYQKSIKSIKESDKQAAKELEEGTKASAKAAQQAIQRSMPKALTKKQADKMEAEEAGSVKKYNAALKAELKGMGSSYAKYVDEAEKLGIKVRKAQGGFGTGQSVSDFKDKDVEQRKQLINLNKRMVKDEKERLKGLAKTSTEYKTLKGEITALEKQGQQMVNLNEDLTQQEKKYTKTRQKNAREERKAEKKKAIAQKKEIQKLKQTTQALQRMGQVASMTAGRIKSGLQNAFVIGTAAAMAFFYKMQPLVDEVLKFEKTIVNANSVFNVTQKELHSVSDEMVRFTMKYGVSAQETATGLYQLASAGLSAAESQEVLQHTMKLAMATQGDHNTLAKLTVQTIAGFGFEMSYAGELTDKFAHSIQKSLIEWQDLASSVKFAMPFFVATGQSIDQLLGGLEVLTNRALEAGIAGRGLRQGLAELAESVGDNTAAFRKLGVEVTDSQGNMLQLTEIAANFAATLEEGVINDTELLTMLIEDLNVRGATAFVHLVQASDEFTAAVHDSANAGGELDEMVKIQNESMMAQIQILRNNVMAIFMLRDANYQGTEFMNAFHEAVIKGVASLKDLIVVETESGMVLTEMGQQIQDIAVQGIAMLIEVVEQIIPIIDQFTQSGGLNVELLKVYLIPLTLTVKAMDLLGPTIVKAVIAYSLLNKTLQLNIVLGALKNFLMEKEALNYVKNISLQGMWNAVSLKGIAIGIADTGWKVAGAIASGAWTLAVGAATLATSLFTAALWLNPMTWFVAACVAAVVIFAVMIYKFYDMTGLLHLMWAGFKALGSLIKWTGEVLYFFLLKPWVELGKIMADWLEGPAFKVMKFFENLVHMVKWVGDEIKNMMGKMGDIPIVGGLFKAD